ncbi:MAG: DUF86 domain-containing protein [Phototrophicales bacterium]|nr:MAG: DUF86 domain-containing protein [Phototrophicales bacterium]
MNEITRAYLVEILERIARIQDYTQDGEAAFLADLRTQDAVLRNFEVIGEIVKRLDKGFVEQNPQIAWRSMAAFRDVIIHDYEDIRLDVIWQTIVQDLPPLRDALNTILNDSDI